MSVLPRRSHGLLLTGALAVIGAAVAGAVLFTSGRASEVNLTSAQFVPEDAPIFIGLNTNLASSQWVAAFGLVKRLGVEDPEGELRTSVEEGGADWEDEIVPFLGGDAAFYFRSVSIFPPSFDGGAIFKANDADKAMAALISKSGLEFEKRAHEGAEYVASDELYLAISGDHVLAAVSEDALREMLDVGAGRKPSLGELAAFRDLRDDITRDFLSFYYVDAAGLFDGSLFDDDVLRKAFQDATGQPLDLQPAGGALTASKAGFAFQAASQPVEANSLAALKPRTSRFAAMVPATTAIFASTAEIAQAWEKSMTPETRAKLDELLAEQDTGPRSLDEAFRQAGAEIGLESIEEVIALLTGEAAIAAWPKDDSVDEPDFVFMAEVGDEAKARTVLQSLAEKAAEESGSPLGSVMVGDVEVTSFADDGGALAGFALHDGVVYIGTLAALREVLAGPGDTLAESSAYTHALSALPTTALGTFIYVDLHTILALSGESFPPEFPLAAETLEGFLLNVVEAQGLVRAAWSVSVKE